MASFPYTVNRKRNQLLKCFALLQLIKLGFVMQVLPPLCAELRNLVMQPVIFPMVLTIAESLVIFLILGILHWVSQVSMHFISSLSLRFIELVLDVFSLSYYLCFMTYT